MVSGTQRRARCAAPARFAHFPSQLRGGRDRAAVPRHPKGHIQIHVRRGALITASGVEAPRLLGKGESYREQGSSHLSHSQREMGAAKPPPPETPTAPSPPLTTTTRFVIEKHKQEPHNNNNTTLPAINSFHPSVHGYYLAHHSRLFQRMLPLALGPGLFFLG